MTVLMPVLDMNDAKAAVREINAELGRLGIEAYPEDIDSSNGFLVIKFRKTIYVARQTPINSRELLSSVYDYFYSANPHICQQVEVRAGGEKWKPATVKAVDLTNHQFFCELCDISENKEELGPYKIEDMGATWRKS